MAVYTFDSEVAKVAGVNGAVIFQNIAWWCAKNAANGKNIHDGKAWTYNSVKAFSELFGWMTERQIQTTLQKLESLELIESGNFNKAAYDRTKWYTVGNAGNEFAKSIAPNWEIHLTKLSNGNNEIVEPIPVVNTDINQIENHIEKETNPNGFAKKPTVPCQGFEEVEGLKPYTVESSQGSGFNAQPYTASNVPDAETSIHSKADTVSVYQPGIPNGSKQSPKQKKAKEPRHRYGEYGNVLLSDSDISKLKKEFPNDWQERIERLSGYMASTGKSYKNHLATIRNWARMDKTNAKGIESRSKAPFTAKGNQGFELRVKEGQTLAEAQAAHHRSVRKQNAEQEWTEDQLKAFAEMGI